MKALQSCVSALCLLLVASGCTDVGGQKADTPESSTEPPTTSPTNATNTSIPAPTNTTAATNSTTGNATGNSTSVVYFEDGAEAPKAWVFNNRILIQPNVGQPDQVVNQNHPLSAGWHASTKEKLSGAKSFTMQDEAENGYHDNEYTHMVSPKIGLKTATSAVLTFSYKGDSEANGIEGLYWDVSADGGSTFTNLGAQKDSKSNEVKTWKNVTADLSKYVGKDIVIRFLFKSDISCSVDTPLPEGCGAGKYTGYFVDDIRVAPA